jgi:3-hydroxyisobutyrate dehydrogenase-like beta-hydroxyacid dehydrogenase
VGAALRSRGEIVLWASAGRSAETAARAAAADLLDVGTVEQLARRSDVIVSLCPPHAALDVAALVPAFSGLYVDANAVAPETARTIAQLVPRFVDGGVIGPPPRQAGTTRLYVAGPEAPTVAALFAGSPLEAIVVPGEPGAASALKMAYAAWTKGTTALLLAIRALARARGIEEPLLAEWERSLPELEGRSSAAARSALAKGWRWVGEMHEIADTFAAAGLPEGFHRGAAEIYERTPRAAPEGDALELVLAALSTRAGHRQ